MGSTKISTEFGGEDIQKKSRPPRGSATGIKDDEKQYL
jgi:hypothetical protein